MIVTFVYHKCLSVRPPSIHSSAIHLFIFQSCCSDIVLFVGGGFGGCLTVAAALAVDLIKNFKASTATDQDFFVFIKFVRYSTDNKST